MMKWNRKFGKTTPKNKKKICIRLRWSAKVLYIHSPETKSMIRVYPFLCRRSFVLFLARLFVTYHLIFTENGFSLFWKSDSNRWRIIWKNLIILELYTELKWYAFINNTYFRQLQWVKVFVILEPFFAWSHTLLWSV